MILINLLPHREAKRKRRKAAHSAGLALGAVAGLMARPLVRRLDQMKSAQMERNAFLGAEIKKLEAQIKDIANLRAEIDALKARQKAVEDLQTDRNIPVHLLNELVKQTPEGVYLTSIRQTGKTVAITGVAQTNERVSEFLRNTLYSPPWLEKPELIEIKAVAAPRRAARAVRLLDARRDQAPAGRSRGPAQRARRCLSKHPEVEHGNPDQTTRIRPRSPGSKGLQRSSANSISRQPGQWPLLPKLVSWLALAGVGDRLGLVSDKASELDAERARSRA